MTDPEIWALYGRRAGDNRQIATLAEATGLPWRPAPLAFTGLSGAPNLFLGATTATLTREARARLGPPWPAIAISAGKRSVPAALWIRKASGGATKLVHIGRPWAPLAWFDLIVTTPQYGLPERPNVIVNTLPLSRPPEPGPVAPDLAALPTPRLCVIAGGNSRPLVFDATAARALAADAVARVRGTGGSLLVATSPRTSPAAATALAEALARADVPMRLSLFGAGENRYADFLSAADAFLVTDDSAAMIAEAALRGKPVALFRLEQRPDWRMRLAGAALGAGGRSESMRDLFDRMQSVGLMTSTRRIEAFTAALDSNGLLAGDGRAEQRARDELAQAAASVLSFVADALPRAATR